MYNIDILQKHYKISLVSSPAAGGGGSADIRNGGGGSFADNFEDGNYHDSQDILIGDDDDDLTFSPRDGRRSSSLLSMRSLSCPLQEVEDEMVEVVATNTFTENIDEEEDEEDDTENIIIPVARLQMPPLTYAEMFDESEGEGEPSDYEQDEREEEEGEGEDTSASAFTIKDSNGRTINLQKREKK